jgi:hypothetical protein
MTVKKAPTDKLQWGEDPGSHYPGDAQHWVGAYSELLRLLEEAVLDLDRHGELSHADLDSYRRLFQKRLAFWEGHLAPRRSRLFAAEPGTGPLALRLAPRL